MKLTLDDVARNARAGNLTRRRRRRIEQFALQARIARLLFRDELRVGRARIATLDQIRRLVANDFLVLGNVGIIGLNVRDPLIHLSERGLQQWAGGIVEPVAHVLDHHYLVVGVSVGFLQTLAHRERVVAQMDITDRIVVRVRAIVDDRHIAKSPTAIRQSSTAIRGANRRCIAHAPRDAEISVKIIATDLLVQIEELVHRNRSGFQCREPILDADVVQRT